MSIAVATLPAQKQLVRIIQGTMGNQRINGIFEYIDCANPDGRGPQIQVVLNNGTHEWISLGAHGKAEPYTLGDAQVADMPAVHISGATSLLSEEEVESIIEERFEVMDALVRSLNASNIKSVVVTGATGVGKTFGTEKYLEQAELEDGQHWGSIGGSCSPFGLYEILYEYRNEGSILVMDDVDVFDDEVKINLLKNALDTKSRRVLDWRSASKALEERGIPNTFEFKGKIIFLTNTNIYSEIKRGTKKAPHLKALIGRSVTLDLGIHDVKTILIWVRHVMRKTDMLVQAGITQEQQEQVISWLEDHRDDLETLSLRTPLMIAEYVKTHPTRWEAMCRHTLLTPIALNHY